MVEPEIARSKEDEYFIRQEMERRRKHAVEEEARMAQEARKALKDLHYMHCPKCGHDLTEVEFRGVKIDQCATCNGIWLDAGELELLGSKEKTGVLGGFLNILK